MADNNRRGRFGKDSDDASQSIFDLFEPPPDQESGSFGRIPIIREDEDDAIDLTEVEVVEAQAAAEAEAAGLQHWTEPATGQIPAALGADALNRANQLEGPSWRGDDPNWSGPDLSDVFADTDALAPGNGLAPDDDLLDPKPAPRRAPTPRKAPEPSLFDRPAAGGTPPPDRSARAKSQPEPEARRGRSALGEAAPSPTTRGAAPAERPARPTSTPPAPAARATGPDAARSPSARPAPGAGAPSPRAAGGDAARRPTSRPDLTAPSARSDRPDRGDAARPAPRRGATAPDAPSPDSAIPARRPTGRDGRPAPTAGPAASAAAPGPTEARRPDAGRPAPSPARPERAAPSAKEQTPPPPTARAAGARPTPTAERRLEGLDLDKGAAAKAAPGPNAAAPAPSPRREAPGPAPRPEPTGAPAPERRPGATGPQRALGPDAAAPAPPGPRARPAPAPGPDGGAIPAPERSALTGRGPAPERLDPDLGYDDYDYDEYDDEFDDDTGGSAGLGVRVLVGVAMAAVVFTALGFGALPTMILVGLLTLLAVMELFNAMRIAGLRPATLLGLVGAVALPASTFVRGEAAYPLVVGLAVVFGMLWYLTGADTERPVLNLGLTLTGILWVGGLAGFAGLILREDLGTQLLLATILITATSDTLAYLGGRTYGTKPFHVASPNKTWEGTLTGFFGALLAGVAIGVSGLIPIFDVDGGFTAVLILALVVGVLAPIGDLAESLVKRDLGIKDMGTILPGHGGVLDRVDGLLFTLPGAYYVAVVYQLF